MNSILKLSIVRTIVPIVYGLIIAALLRIGFELDPAQQDGLTAWLTSSLDAIIAAVWYVGARLLEKHWPAFGAVMLGSRKSPDVYSAYNGPGREAVVTVASDVDPEVHDGPKHRLGD